MTHNIKTRFVLCELRNSYWNNGAPDDLTNEQRKEANVDTFHIIATAYPLQEDRTDEGFSEWVERMTCKRAMFGDWFAYEVDETITREAFQMFLDSCEEWMPGIVRIRVSGDTKVWTANDYQHDCLILDDSSESLAWEDADNLARVDAAKAKLQATVDQYEYPDMPSQEYFEDFCSTHTCTQECAEMRCRA